MSAVANTCKSVLLVDDGSFDNFVSQSIMEQFQFAKNIAIETTGKRAMDLLRTCSYQSVPDLILLDINMPIMGGGQFVEAFKSQTDRIKNKCKIVILSASFHSPEIDQLSKDDCVLGAIIKPLGLDSLKRVKELLSA